MGAVATPKSKPSSTPSKTELPCTDLFLDRTTIHFLVSAGLVQQTNGALLTHPGPGTHSPTPAALTTSTHDPLPATRMGQKCSGVGPHLPEETSANDGF